MAGVKSADRVLDIFELLREAGQPLTLSEMKRALDLPSSSLHGLAQTLTARGYLERDESTRRYRLGPAIIALAHYQQEAVDMDISAVAEPELTKLCQVSGESVALGVLDGRDVVFILRRVSSQVVRVVNPVGTRLPAHATALGKCLLTGLSKEELYRLYPSQELPAVLPNTITDRAALLEVLDQARMSRLAYDREESTPGVFAIASPILDHSGAVVASVSLAFPIGRATAERMQWGGRLVIASTSQISRSLGYRET